MWQWLVLLWMATKQAAQQPSDLVVLYVGHVYRFSGDLVASGPVDTATLLRKMQMTAATDIRIGQRPPYRISWTSRMPMTYQLRLGSVFVLTEDVAVLVRSVNEIATPNVMVGYYA